MKLIITVLLTSIALSESAFGQICVMSEYPYGFGNYPRMHGAKFKAITDDLPFISKTERKRIYSQYWINTDVLNVRKGPGFEYKIISETYYGNLVFALAKTGDWVAIGKGFSDNDLKIEPKWVHINYLSPNRIKEQVGAEILKKKCGFKQYGESSSSKSSYDIKNNIFNSCNAVVGYLNQQRLLSQNHDYYDEYYIWRSSQRNPDKYRTLPCDRRR